MDPRSTVSYHRKPSRQARFIAAASLAAAFWLTGSAARSDGRQAVAASLESLARESLAQLDGEIAGTGTREPVEVIRDRWGVPHLYARSADDLFFAQGYVVAQDRLWQMEWWRREREGRLAEILGAPAVDRDRVARLLKYRGPMDDREWTSYHPEARRLMTAFIRGVNAFIETHADNLPIEFKLTGIKPQRWEPETLLLRQASFGDATNELQLARSVARLGAEEANRLRAPDPWDDLAVPSGLDIKAIDEAVVQAVRGGGGRLPEPEIVEPYRRLPGLATLLPGQILRPQSHASGDEANEGVDPGSNNWVVSGKMSATGMPVVANDPHREVTNPSLRYVMHLNAPGWNVIGASEPPFVGVHIGHSERLAWGLTIVGTDQHDVYVEELNPDDPDQVKWNDRWEPLQIVREQWHVKGAPDATAELKYSRHGPIFHVDRARGRAYALRSALNEPGTAPYLASLRLAQAANCREFLDAAMFWKAPSENLICGDVEGSISWQASALTPARSGWVGRLPVPGTGQYEWSGFRTDLPRELNPPRGFVATANHNIQPDGYRPPLMFKTSANREFERMARLLQVLDPAKRFTIDDHRRLQLDALSLRARADLRLFKGWTSATPAVERARALLAAWDGMLNKDSTAAALYTTIADERPGGTAAGAPTGGRGRGGSALAAIRANQEDDGGRRVEAAIANAIDTLNSSLGADWNTWRYGRVHLRRFPHPFVNAFDLPTHETSGGAGTVAADGASYREILDVADWDRSIATNTPGQSGQPASPYYGNLLPMWANGEYFPLVYSRPAVDREKAHRLVLRP